MGVDTDTLLALPASEQLQIIELLWEKLGESAEPIPLPEWIEREAVRRRAEIAADPSISLDHETTWDQIRRRGT